MKAASKIFTHFQNVYNGDEECDEWMNNLFTKGYTLHSVTPLGEGLHLIIMLCHDLVMVGDVEISGLDYYQKQHEGRQLDLNGFGNWMFKAHYADGTTEKIEAMRTTINQMIAGLVRKHGDKLVRLEMVFLELGEPVL